jgi:prevent-host-death family protein
MARVYSTYEAKAKLSEILRKVRSGQRVGITHRGELIAEVTPVEPVRETLERRLKRLQAQGVIIPAKNPGKPFLRIARRPGALKRFLASRD